MYLPPRYIPRPLPIEPRLCIAFVVAVLGCAVSAAADDVASPEGASIYSEKCASCHGVQGEGVDGAHESPLVGDRSIRELAQIIDDTMPEGEPEQLGAAGSLAVAEYIHGAFYSEIAQFRNQPAALEFSRLTVRQYQESLADLLQSFNGYGEWKDERGLRGEYFDDKGMDRNKLTFERVDAVVDFDFGLGSPDPAKESEEEFSMRWEGSLLAPETGDYEFLFETENAARLYINDRDTPLVDAWVRSGPETQFRGVVRLLGGRLYPLKLDYFKFKEKSASIRLKWKPPHGVEQLIPQRCLTPEKSSEVFVVNTPFPPDDRSTGFERGTSVSPEWNEATTFAAIEAADYILDNLRDLAQTRRDDDDRAGKLRRFCEQFAERAFRRPLSDEEREIYVDRHFDDAGDDVNTAVKRVVLIVLKSPRFLYREIGWGRFDDYDAAAWLSFTLWDSLPDRELWNAARDGRLRERDQLTAQADRMLGDLRARAKLRDFLHQWLKIDRFEELVKNGENYPGFDEALIADLRVSLDLLLDDIVWSDASDFRQLFLRDELPMSPRMAAFYGAAVADGADFENVVFEADRRGGVLSHPYLLAGFAYTDTSSPIHRGVFLARNVLGRILNPPPIAVSPLPPEIHPDLTTRDRVDVQTSAAMCVKCHGMINSLGFSLEHFDAVGRFRDIEKGQPINAAGAYLTRDGDEVTFNGVQELADFLVHSPEVHAAFGERLFQYFTKQPIRAFGADHRDELRARFAESEFSIRRLLVEITVSSAEELRTLATQPRDAEAQSTSTGSNPTHSGP
jgi:hypothetical protein